ncbi:MAG: T9SS type A sorting domain-containing protein [Bacteroidota bacterium]
MKHIQLFCCICLALFINSDLLAQCNPDVTPPTPYCKNGLTAQLGSNGEVEIWAEDINDGSFDNCPGALSFFIETAPASTSPPSTQSVIFDSSDIGNNDVAMWVTDQAGISDFCTVTIEITECQGNQNLTCNALVNLALDPNGTAAVTPEMILEGGPYCYHEMEIFIGNSPGTPIPPPFPVDTSYIGINTALITDASTGNSCWGSIVIQAFPGGINCNPDTEPPVAICDAYTVISLGLNGASTIGAQVFDDGSYDQCGLVDYFIEKELDPVPTLPSTTTITFDTSDIGMHTVALWVVDEVGLNNYCTVEVEIKSCFVGNLTCNAFQTVGIPTSGSVPIVPDDVLESGPLCPWYGIDFLNGSTPPGLDTVFLDTSHIGTIQQIVVYDLFNGNSCWGEIEVIDCADDTIAPTAVCVSGLVVEMGKAVPGEVTVWGDDFDNGSFDGCSGVEFRIELGPTPSAQAPLTEFLTFEENEVGNYDIIMWVIDENGNENYCATTLEILSPDCNNDTTPPICTAPADITVSKGTIAALGIELANDDDLAMYFGQFDAVDNCGVEEVWKFRDFSWSSGCGYGHIDRKFEAIDSAGNHSETCEQTINFYNAWELRLPEDYLPGDPFIDTLEVIDQDSGLLAVTFDDLIFDYNCDGDPDRIVRMHTVINWCAAIDPNVPIIPIERLDLDGDGTVGDGFDIRNGLDSIALLENGFPVSNLAETGGGITYMQIIRFNYNDTLDFNVTGTVYHDVDEDCDLDGTEPSLAGWPVNITGLETGTTLTTITDSLGQYSFDLCTIDTLAEVSLDVPFNYGQVCGTTYTVQLSPGASQQVVQDIPVHYDTLCPILWVDISTPFLRRCFENYYTVSYCNYSNETIEDVYVEVQLDPFMTFTSSEITGTSLGGNLYTFDIGDVAAGECGNFKIYFDLECTAELGASHCVDAHIFPDTLCAPLLLSWSGANIEAEAVCQNDTVFLSVKNTGTAAMAGPLEYIVVEDLIMLNADQFDLAPGEVATMPGIPANGATYRIEAEQEPGHPFPGNVAAAVEGCNGVNIFGLLNLFPLENPNPFIATDCQQNIGSFDPNDKQAFPTGYGDEHFIKKNTDIDYLIRFQNTGTDTAFKVVIIDELDTALDPATIRPGAASHPYQFELIDGNTLRFTFDDIMLPDSNINEPASHGFVKFKASQKVDLPLGTVIENEAAIYFDFNDPIITNTVFHTLGENFVEVINDTDERPHSLGALKTYPNPSLGDVTFEIPESITAEAVFILHDALGKQLVFDAFSAKNTYRFERGDLAPGIYFYQVEMDGVGMYSGKVILK